MPKFLLALFLSLLAFAAPGFVMRTSAAPCGGDFNAFLAAMAREAQAAGVSSGVIQSAFAGVAQDQAVLSFDRRQHATFRQSFEQYSSTRVTQARITRGRQMLQKHAQLLARVQQQFGVPKELIVAIWGLESDYGSGDIGKLPVVRVLATLAHDCRRTQRFQGELIAALKILQRGDLRFKHSFFNRTERLATIAWLRILMDERQPVF